MKDEDKNEGAKTRAEQRREKKRIEKEKREKDGFQNFHKIEFIETVKKWFKKGDDSGRPKATI